MENYNFWDYEVWGSILVFAVLLVALLVGNVLKKSVPLLQRSLIPTSVLGGGVLLIVAAVFKAVTGEIMFDTAIFGEKGTSVLETLTYHTLALGFIASSLKTSGGKLTKRRSIEVFNTGVTTVSTYLLQGIFGLGITLIAAIVLPGFFEAAGVLLPFGYGQGTGQALNYGNIYQDMGFDGGRSFGLTIAALGFLSAAIGGVFHLNIQKRRGKLVLSDSHEKAISPEEIQGKDEIPMQESIDKMTVQFALIGVAYLVTYLLMFVLGALVGDGLRATIYGFNFLLGVLSATLVKTILNFFRKQNVIKKEYTNNFLLTRVSNFFFDIMVIAGVAAIRLDALEKYWGVILILGVVGLVITYVYNRIVAKLLFPRYKEEQFLMMYGMLTGTASTGTILLREVDGDFKTPAADNMVYQNFPAIVFGFPMMFLATMAPSKPVLTLIIFILFFLVMNVILFRSFLFKKRKK